MARSRALDPELPEGPPGFSDLCLIAVPVETFRALSDRARDHGMNFADFLARAVAELDARLTERGRK